MYCQKCGRDCGSDLYCIQCGNKLEQSEQKCTCHKCDAPKKSNACAIIGFIFSFICPLVGLILGVIGIGYKDRFKPEHKALAIAAVSISGASIVLNFISYFYLMNTMMTFFETILKYVPMVPAT